MNEQLFLQQGSPLVTEVDPFDVYEVLVPVLTLLPNIEHWLAVTYDGGESVQPLVTRKKKVIKTEDLYGSSDFNKRHGGKLGRSRALKDVKYENAFTLNE